MCLSPRQVLELATINGARDLGIADRVGSLTPGKRADLILVRTADLNMAPLGDPVQAIVRSAQPHNVDTVVVDGRILKRGGRMTAIDVDQVVREAAESLAATRPGGRIETKTRTFFRYAALKLRAGTAVHAVDVGGYPM